MVHLQAWAFMQDVAAFRRYRERLTQILEEWGHADEMSPSGFLKSDVEDAQFYCDVQIARIEQGLETVDPPRSILRLFRELQAVQG